jgi:tetratricopeptide (TPR) repeat protein
VLGSTENDKGMYSEATRFHLLAMNGKCEICELDLTRSTLRQLINENYELKRSDESEKWFKRLATEYEPSAWEWDSEGDRRHAVEDYRGAEVAYENAAGADKAYVYDYCYAATNSYLQPVTNADGVIQNGKKCIDASISDTSKADEHHFKNGLPIVYRDMATVLESRGVYSSALEYIKESLSLVPDNPFSFSIEADIYADTNRNAECVAAAQTAIKLSDGKYSSFQFKLGYCYFQMENWSQAATSFRLAAEGNTTDATSAFNLGLSLSRQGFNADAKHWFTEALHRNPDPETKAKILDFLR